MIGRKEREIMRLRQQLMNAPIPSDTAPVIRALIDGTIEPRATWEPDPDHTYREQIEDWWENGVGKHAVKDREP